jgi:hypothetical protein
LEDGQSRQIRIGREERWIRERRRQKGREEREGMNGCDRTDEISPAF